MMINIAQPLFVKAEALPSDIDLGNGSFEYYYNFDTPYEMNTNRYSSIFPSTYSNYLYLDFLSSYVNGSYRTGGVFMFYWSDNATCTFENGVISVSSSNSQDIKFIYDQSPGLGYSWDGVTPMGITRDKTVANITYFTFNTLTGQSSIYGWGTFEYFWNSAYHNNANYGSTLTYYDCYTNCPTLSAPAGLDIDVLFTPELSGNVSRSYNSNGLSYNSDKFIMEVTNNSDNAQFAMFIVPSGDDITIPALQWSTSDIYSGNPVFVYVKDEWIYDSLTIGDFSSSSFKPSVLHYIKENETKYYEIAWASMDIEPNTSYDVVVYAAESDSDYYVSLNTSLEYEEVYRSTFYMSNPASYNPDNDITDNYSWNSSIDHKDLFDITKAQQDQWGNFYVNNNNSVKGYLSFNSVSDIISSFMAFLKATFAYLPDGIQLTFYIGLTSLVVLAIIKKVCA